MGFLEATVETGFLGVVAADFFCMAVLMGFLGGCTAGALTGTFFAGAFTGGFFAVDVTGVFLVPMGWETMVGFSCSCVDGNITCLRSVWNKIK